MTANLTAISLMLLVLFAGIFSGYYLFAILGGTAFIFGYLFWGPGVADMLYFTAFNTIKDYTLLAVPLFIYMGSMLDKSGVAEKLFDVLSIVLGRMKGGLAVAAMTIAILFAATTGIVGASVVAMGLIFLPAMLRRNYDKAYATGVIASGGTLGILIPPSIMLVILGSSANVSVARLFYGAMVPGLLLGFCYIIYIIIRAKLNPELGPPLPEAELSKYSTGWKVKNLLIHVFPVLSIVLAVLGTIWLGIAPPTEAAAVGGFAATIVALVYKKLNLKVLTDTLKQTMLTSAMVYAIMIFAGFFASVFMRIGGNKVISNLFLSLPFDKWGIFAIMMLIIFLLGFIMDWLCALMIIIPVFLPIAIQAGFDPLYFCIMICLINQTSFLTPPFAMAIFYLKGVAPPGVSLSHIINGVWPYCVIVLGVFLLCCIFPDIIMWLPSFVNR